MPLKQLRYLLGVFLLSVLLSHAAFAYDWRLDKEWYWGISGDVTWLTNTDGGGTGGGGDIAFGRKFMMNNAGNFRGEVEGGFHDVSDSHYFTYMANLYYDFDLGSSLPWNLSPYVGAGIGDATLHLGEHNRAGDYNIHGDAFAYQFMAGLNFTTDYFMPNVTWAIGYRYVGSDNQDATDNAGINRSDGLGANNIELTARFHF